MYKAIITFVCLSFALVSCNEQGGKNTCDDSFYRDLPQLKESGEITAVTLYSSTSYFQYRMQPMGYEYDLAEDFAESLGLKLVIKIAQTDSQLVAMLRSGEADRLRAARHYRDGVGVHGEARAWGGDVVGDDEI